MDPTAIKKSMLSDKDIKAEKARVKLPTFMTKPRQGIKEAMKHVQSKY